MDPYIVLLAVPGVAVLAAAILPGWLRRAPVSLPMIYVGVGALIFWLPLGLDGPRPGADSGGAERLTELVVIVSLMSAGLKISRGIGWRSWGSTWRLLGITMPLTIAAIAALGMGVLALPLSAAVLLGAVLAPTDPVLASDVQIEGPANDDTNDEVRFALTSEAGLNDGLAFPFTNLAIALAAGGSWFGGWLLDDVIVKLSVGVVVGLVLGRVIGWFAFGSKTGQALARSGQGFVALGATLAVYGICEMLHGYGFLAVFVAAVTIRRSELDHEYHQVLHDFAETLERLAGILFLLLLGGAAVDGALRALSVEGALVAVAIVLLVRPVTGWIGMLGTRTERTERFAISFFGIRGMGTIYYLAHAVNEELFPRAAEVWAVAITAILVSIVVHGSTASAVFTVVDRHLERRVRRRYRRVIPLGSNVTGAATTAEASAAASEVRARAPRPARGGRPHDPARP
jgi:sodium/hydrogen antiporter